VLGRRGPLQAAYTSPELLALGYLKGVDIVIDPAELELDPESRALLHDPEVEPSLKLKYTLAQEYAAGFGRVAAQSGSRRIVFRYLVSPTALTGTGHVATVEYAHNELVSENGRLVAWARDHTGSMDTSLVLRSVGYRGEPVADVAFDENNGIIPNERG